MKLLAEMLGPLKDGLPNLEKEHDDLVAATAKKAEEVRRAKAALRGAGLIEKKKTRKQRRNRGISTESLERAIVAIEKMGGAHFSALTLKEKSGLSIHTSYAAIDVLYKARKLRKVGKRKATPDSYAKATFYAAIKGR